MAARKPKSNPVEEEIDIQRLRTDDEYKNQLRLRAQTDLYWLATKVLVNDQGTPSYPDINVRTHREVANFFVKKDPDKTLDEQDKVKQRLLLMPRGTFKTSFNIVDTLQWILCFPDIAIFVMTAANTDDSPLADVFLEEVARHFLNVTERDWKPLHLLFPEFVITKMPKKGWFVSPARKTYRRDATVMATSIESSLSGWHFDVIKFEDIQDNRNSQTSASIRKVKNNLFINLKMLMSWGYREGTGTRYGPMDVYGLVIERLDPRVGKVMWKPAMQVKPHVWDRHPKLRERAEDYGYLFEELQKDDWELFFPEFLPYDKLMESRNEDENSFMTQQMNVATGSFKPIFPIEKLIAATLDEEHMPITGTVQISWRLEMEGSDQVAGACGVMQGNRMYIVDIERGKWTPSTIAIKIVKMAKRNTCHKISIEETPGARFQETAIRNEALKEGWELFINWLPYQRDETERSLRIKSCEPVLGSARLYFSREIRILREVHRQLYHYGMIEETEIADVVSRVCEKLPKLIGDSETGTVEDDLAWTAIRERAQRDRVFNQGQYRTEEPEIDPADIESVDVEWSPAPNEDGLEEMMPGLSG
jgi:hypothetical protein